MNGAVCFAFFSCLYRALSRIENKLSQSWMQILISFENEQKNMIITMRACRNVNEDMNGWNCYLLRQHFLSYVSRLFVTIELKKKLQRSLSRYKIKKASFVPSRIVLVRNSNRIQIEIFPWETIPGLRKDTCRSFSSIQF